MTIPKIIFWPVSSVISVLFAGNVYFVSRLVNKIDSTEQIVWQLRQEVVILKFTIEELQRRQKECHSKSENHF